MLKKGGSKEKNNSEPKQFFKVDDNFVKQLNQILEQNFVFEHHRKIIIDEFIKLIKSSIVSK